ncbi:MAG: threonylcarbamoyl-AMP synthase [Rickettsiaceae bacterium]|jgi:L-threonylcarbamoyladenylate synthase|nr:threonylcarbamoyl-AMP synthase [Rickettsiaceae bacterium]
MKVSEASKILKNGGIICFATETVYALACDASNDLAVAKLYKIKKREPKKPIAVFVKDLAMAKQLLDLNTKEIAIAEKFMPGMITLVAKKRAPQIKTISISSLLNSNIKDLGFRIPDHKFCLDLLNEFNGVIAATSANPSNKEPAISYNQAKEYFQDKVDLIIDGGICVHKIASTVLRVGREIEIIRPGLITKDQLDTAISQI